MKFFLLVSLLTFFILPQQVLANGAGLPAFFKINDKYAISNPLQTLGITSSSFLIPQDFAPENYHRNQPIAFTIDQKQLEPVFPLQVLQTTTYNWDFGDGEKADGLTNTHTYTKIGSYILVLTINIYEEVGQPPTQFIDSFFLNVLPEITSYALPQASLKINELPVRVNPRKPLLVDFSLPISFDGSNSLAPSSRIVSYMWNFGDGQTSTQPRVKHVYANTDPKVVIFRVKDANGFISDEYIQLINTATRNKNILTSFPQTPYFPYLFGALLLIIVGIGAQRLRRKNNVD